MAGINRLGKGAPKPGTLRPADPNRFKTQDFFSKDAEDDPEYLRHVLEVEQMTAHKSSAILQRGAFDKGDALYLRDEDTKARNAELELRDAELAKFARLRYQVEQATGIGDGPGPPIKRPKISRPRLAPRATGDAAGAAATANVAQGGAVDSGMHAASVIEQAKAPEKTPQVAGGLGLGYESSDDDGSESDDAAAAGAQKSGLKSLPGADVLLKDSVPARQQGLEAEPGSDAQPSDQNGIQLATSSSDDSESS